MKITIKIHKGKFKTMNDKLVKLYAWYTEKLVHLYNEVNLDIYSRAMKTQHPNVHRYPKDILNIFSQRISSDFMNTKNKHHIDFISFNVKCPNIYTHVHFLTAVK